MGPPPSCSPPPTLPMPPVSPCWRPFAVTDRSEDRDATLHDRPAEALRIALKRSGMNPGDLDLVEVNEAFAAVALWSARSLDIDASRINVHGGAIALGHPLGATGARIVVTLINALRARGAESVQLRCAAAAVRATPSSSKSQAELLDQLDPCVVGRGDLMPVETTRGPSQQRGGFVSHRRICDGVREQSNRVVS